MKPTITSASGWNLSLKTQTASIGRKISEGEKNVIKGQVTPHNLASFVKLLAMEDALIQGASKNTDFLSILAARGVCRSWRSTCPRLVRSIVFDDSTILSSISNLAQANAACRNAGNALQRMILDSEELDTLHLNITFDCIAGSVMDSLQRRPDLWPKLRCVSLSMNPMIFIALHNESTDWDGVIEDLEHLNGVCIRMARSEGKMPRSLQLNIKIFSFKMDLDSIVDRILEPPVGIFSGLRMLKLENVSGSFFAYMDLPYMCRSLEHLYLKDIFISDDARDYDELYLPFSALLTFHLEGHLDDDFVNSITLDAPRLEQLYFMAYLDDFNFTTQGTCLKEATFYEIMSLDLDAAPALKKLNLVGKFGDKHSLGYVEGYAKDEIVSLLTLAQQLEELEVGPYTIMEVTYHWNTSEIGSLPAINLLTIDAHPGLRNEELCKDGLVRFALMFREVKQIKLRGGIQADLLQFQNSGGSHLLSKVELIPRT